MSGAASQRLAFTQKEQATLGLPPGAKFFSPAPFGGMNQQDARIGMPDEEFFWLENWIKLGALNLRTTGDVGTALYTATAGKTIISFADYTDGFTNFFLVFFADGTAIQVRNTDGAVTIVSATPGTFYLPTFPYPATVQAGTPYILISNNFGPNNYWIWDGKILYSAGGVAPVITITDSGSGYVTTPTVTLIGGSGSGATFLATINDGAVVAINVVTPGTGYQPTDSVQLVITGGGSDDTAVLQAVLGSSFVESIIVTNGGTGYTSLPSIAITGGGGSGAVAIPILTGGVVTSVFISNQGTGYTSTPSVVFSGGGGSGATGAAILAALGVASVTVVDGGTGYIGTPLLSIVGGGGSGAQAVATTDGNAITAVTVTASGTGYTSTPSVVIQSGVNRAATAIIDLMPFGISGSAMENYLSRVWIINPFQQGTADTGGEMSLSAAESLVNFSTADGGDAFTDRDRFLRQRFTAIRQSSGYLYAFGDSSVSVISNVQTSGVPATTSFTFQNVDPQVGAAWRDSLQDAGRTILFGNPLGGYGIYGGAATKVSTKLDNLFTAAVFPVSANPAAIGPGVPIFPSSAVTNIYAKKLYLLLLTITDPFTKTPRNVMVGWDEKDWAVYSQSSALTYIGTQEIASVNTAWGTDGTALFPLLETPSPTLNKRISTKLYGAQTAFITKQAWGFYLQVANNSTVANVTLSVSIDNENAGYPLPVQPRIVVPQGQSPVFGATSGDVPGQELGWTIDTAAQDISVQGMILAYTDVTLLGGPQVATMQQPEVL